MMLQLQRANRSSLRRCISVATTRWLSTGDHHPKVVFLNASRLDYNEKLDWSRWHDNFDLVLGRHDRIDSDEEILDMVQGARVVVAKEMVVSEEVVRQFVTSSSSIGLICEAGTGFNNWPVQVARSLGIPVCNVPTYSTQAVAHTAITYLLNLSVSMFQQQAMLQTDDRANFTGPFTLPLQEINGKTIALIGGAGRIGTDVAQICLALGMEKVLISSRAGQLPPHHALFNHPRVECTDDVDSILPRADFVSLHTPLNDQTRGTFGRNQIELMKPTAFLINTSRGAVCNEPELVACLQEKVIAGAGLDVTTSEPPDMDSEIWNLDNCWLSPHIGWRRHETRQRLVDATFDNIQAYQKAQSATDYINVVN